MSLRDIKRSATGYFMEEAKLVCCTGCGRNGKVSLHLYTANLAGRIVKLEWFCQACGLFITLRPKLVQYRQDFDTSPSPSKGLYFGSCDNCGAKLNALWPGGRDWEKRRICCADCMFHPMGCRCKYGEFGEAESRFYD